MYLAAYGRTPNADELHTALDFTARDGWTGYARVLLESNEFYYVD